jgi:hypothetical protein
MSHFDSFVKPYVVIVTCSDRAEQRGPLPKYFFNASFIKLRFQVRIVVLLMIEGVWDVTLCRVVELSYCLHLAGQAGARSYLLGQSTRLEFSSLKFSNLV